MPIRRYLTEMQIGVKMIPVNKAITVGFLINTLSNHSIYSKLYNWNNPTVYEFKKKKGSKITYYERLSKIHDEYRKLIEKYEYHTPSEMFSLLIYDGRCQEIKKATNIINLQTKRLLEMKAEKIQKDILIDYIGNTYLCEDVGKLIKKYHIKMI